MLNPFRYGIIVDEPFFIDREDEQKDIYQWLSTKQASSYIRRGGMVNHPSFRSSFLRPPLFSVFSVVKIKKDYL